MRPIEEIRNEITELTERRLALWGELGGASRSEDDKVTLTAPSSVVDHALSCATGREFTERTSIVTAARPLSSRPSLIDHVKES